MSSFFNFAASQATGADFYSFCSTVDLCTDSNKVRSELSVSSVFGMTYIVTDHAFFSANLTFARHYITSMIIFNKDLII